MPEGWFAGCGVLVHGVTPERAFGFGVGEGGGGDGVGGGCWAVWRILDGCGIGGVVERVLVG